MYVNIFHVSIHPHTVLAKMLLWNYFLFYMHTTYLFYMHTNTSPQLFIMKITEMK